MTVLKKLMDDQRLNQVDLAKLVGTSQPQIHKLVSGKLRLGKEWAERLAPHLKTSAERLMFPNGPDIFGFDERLLRLSKVNWVPSQDFDKMIDAIDLLIRLAEGRDPDQAK